MSEPSAKHPNLFASGAKDLSEMTRSDLARIYVVYAPRVRNLAIRLLGDSDEADDVVQDVFLSLWERRSGLGGVRAIDGYLLKMTRNTIFNVIRHRAIAEKYAKGVRGEETETAADDPTEELLKKINDAIAAMPEQRRRIFQLSRNANLSHLEISAMMNVSPATVHYHISRALAELRRLLSVMILQICLIIMF